MPPEFVRAIVGAAALLLVSACATSQPSPAVDPEPANANATATLLPATPSASPSSPSTGPTGTASPDAGATAEDLELIRDFVSFASEPSPDTAVRLPFATEVRLGLSRVLRSTLDEDTVPRASAWRLRAKQFRGYVGPFSALEPLRRHADRTGSSSVGSRGGAFDVSIGDHPHCVSPPVPAPVGYEEHRRVSVQPSETSIDSCLAWFSVDLFLDREGRIAAVTLDVWEP